MPIVPVDRAHPGMKLSKAVTNESGAVLFEAGRMLTRQLIAELLNANIRSVYIVGTLDRAGIEKMLSNLRNRFAKTRHGAHMAMLEELVIEHIEEFHAQ
jgi:hypothetical protein